MMPGRALLCSAGSDAGGRSQCRQQGCGEVLTACAGTSVRVLDFDEFLTHGLNFLKVVTKVIKVICH